MVDRTANNKRIAKNTLLLYGRMLLMMLISLYTSRVVLSALGVVDYGIYNVVGGVVSLFSVLSGSLTTAISRFITFELGKSDILKLKKVFSTALLVQLALIIIITLLLETIGIWLLNSKMIIPSSRLTAANWVYQISVLTFAVNLWTVPFNATIIAHEKMSAFAYISIFDAVAKLLIAFVILVNPFDRLIYYGILVFVAGIVQQILYMGYCSKNFEECKIKLYYDKQTLREVFSFAGWNFIGASSAVLRDQGGNILINLFFGPAINAARGISMYVNVAVTGFVTNFMTALNPQITKNYAAGEFQYMFNLIFQGARLSYYILLILALPIIFTAPYLLELWLKIVPDHAVNFSRLVLVFALSECLASPLVTAMLATGKIRNYQIVVGSLQLLNLPLSYLFLKMSYPPEVIFGVAIVVSIICEIARLYILRGLINLPVGDFLRKVYLNVIIVSIIASIIPLVFYNYIQIINLSSFIFLAFITETCTLISIFYVGCNKDERTRVVCFVKNKIRKFV